MKFDASRRHSEGKRLDVKPVIEQISTRGIEIEKLMHTPITTGMPPIKQKLSKKPMLPVTSLTKDSAIAKYYSRRIVLTKLIILNNCNTVSRPPALRPPPIPVTLLCVGKLPDMPRESREVVEAEVVAETPEDDLPPIPKDPSDAKEPNPRELTTPPIVLALRAVPTADPGSGTTLVRGLGLELED